VRTGRARRRQAPALPPPRRAHHPRCHSHRTGVGAEDDIRVEQLHQRFEVTRAGRGQERCDDLSLTGRIRVRQRDRALDAAPGAARKLPRPAGGSPDDGRDLVEGHIEHVVQHEGEPVRRGQGLEDDEQRQTDGVGQERLLLRIELIVQAHDRIRHVSVQRLLASCLP
jgi:hypothetical protein